jgi:hypothetical protein
MGYRKTHRFKQSEYIKSLGTITEGLDGLCLGLVTKWVQIILSGPKDGWGAPEKDAASRFSIFLEKDTYTEIAQMHRLSKAKFGKLRLNLGFIINGIQVSKLLKGYIDEHSRSSFIHALDSELDEIEISGNKTAKSALSKSGYNIGDPASVTWANLTKHLEPLSCYAMITGDADGEHAIGIYKTAGYLNSDYYIFEPNYGEFKAAGDSSFDELMLIMRNDYPERNSVRIFRISST